MNTTNWKFYTTNPEVWIGMLSACEEATESIDLENFIFTPDAIGTSFIDVCAKKATEGVKVRFIWDAAGSFSFFGSSIAEDLRKKGIELIFFKTLVPGFFNLPNYRSWYFRNHRRTLVIDGKIGFTGSTSISARMENWRDTNVRIEGPVVADMKSEFERMWNRAHGKRLPKMRTSRRNGSGFEYVTNNPLPRKHFLYKQIREAVRSAEKSIYITTPYFVPTHHLSRLLHLAAKRGVDIKIILPESSDFPTVDLGARTFFHTLLKEGIRIYLYKGKMIHAKTIVVDHKWSTVGTMNLDHISLQYNFEANLISTNQDFARDLITQFDVDLENTEEVTLVQWNRRFFVEKIATFFVKLFRGFL